MPQPAEPGAPLSVALTTNTLTAGGAERQRVLLANGLAARGQHVVLYCLQGLGPLAADVAPAVTVVQRDYRRGPLAGHNVLVTGTTNTETAFAVLGKVRSRGRLRWLAAVHNPMGEGAPPLRRFARAAVPRADAVAALNAWHAGQLKARWGLVSDVLLGNGVDAAAAAEVRAVRAEARFDYDVGYLGRLSTHHKGLDTLLRALAEPAAARLRLGLAGTGPDEADLRRLARGLGVDDRIDWLGHQRPESFLPRVRALALLSRYEGESMVGLEARAAGVPLVATRTAGIDDATLVDGDDLPQVAAALAAVVAEPLPRGHGSVRTVEQMSDAYLAALQQLVTPGVGKRLVVHVGNDPDGSGGIAAVLRMHRAREMPGFETRMLTSYRQDAAGPWGRQRPALAAALALLRHRWPGALVHVHLSQRGSSLREGSLALLAARRHPVVVTLHGGRMLTAGWAERRLHRVLLARVTAVHGFDDRYREQLGVPPEQWHRLPNDVDVPPEPPAAKEPIVLFAGALRLAKGVDVLLDAWTRIAPAGWTLLLAGPVWSEMQSSVDAVRDRSDVRVLGELPHPEVLRLMERAAVVVQPSRFEAFPMAVCEALARGCAVVGTDVGGLGSLLREAEQTVVAAEDAQALARVLADLLGDSCRRAAQGADARWYAEAKLAFAVVSTAWDRLYSGVIHDHQLSRPRRGS